MTDEERKRLRETCEAVTKAREDGYSLLSGERARALTEFRRTVDAETVIALLDDNERLDRMLDDEIEERDARLKQIDHIADALGDDGEWSNLHDRGDSAYELALGAVGEVESLRTEIATITAERDALRAEVERLRAVATDIEMQRHATAKARDQALAALDYLAFWKGRDQHHANAEEIAAGNMIIGEDGEAEPRGAK